MDNNLVPKMHGWVVLKGEEKSINKSLAWMLTQIIKANVAMSASLVI